MLPLGGAARGAKGAPVSTWVLLRGLAREARHWGDFPALLRERIPDAHVITPDLSGNGRLHRLVSPTRVEDMAEHCRRALAEQGIAAPYHLLALSLGAMVAVAWTAQHPDEVSACVLMNTSLRPFNPFFRRLRPRSYPTLLRLALAPGDAQSEESLILRLTSSRRAGEPQLVAAWAAYRSDSPVTRSNVLRQLFAAARYRAPLRRPEVPVLLLAGAKDGLVDSRCSQRLAECWHVPLRVHPDAGHDLPLDDGPWVARQVLAWLTAGKTDCHTSEI